MPNNIPIQVEELIETDTINTWARGYLRKTTAKTVNTTTTATDLLNGEFTLPAAAMGTDRVLRLSAWGDWKNGASLDYDIPRFQPFLGGTMILDTSVIGSGVAQNDGVRYFWHVQVDVMNRGSASSQVCYISGDLSFNSVSANPVDGVIATPTVALTGASGPLFTGKAIFGGGTTKTVDTSTSCALALKVINASSSANYETKLYGALVEII